MNDPLEANGPLNVHDYEFLKGNEVYWPSWGAGFATVQEWCRNKGYGDFGKPTKRGIEAMETFTSMMHE